MILPQFCSQRWTNRGIMALKLVPSSQFKRDYKRARKRGLDMRELQVVLDKLCAEEPLEERYRDHALTNNYAGFRECHVRPTGY